MTSLPVPPISDLARVQGDDREKVVAWFRDYYDAKGAPFNYLAGTRSIKNGYRGLHNLAQLEAGCLGEETAQGRKSNIEIVHEAAPLSFDRKTQVFDLPRTKFSFGRNHLASYRIPFFFVEDGVVKLYFLQPRKGCSLTYDQLCMVATIHKHYLLDQEFFGQPSDVEYVDLSAPPGMTERVVQRYQLSDLALWSEAKLGDRLTLIAEALDFLAKEDVVRPRKRHLSQPAADMPLF